jgi:hypothetical protein
VSRLRLPVALALLLGGALPARAESPKWGTFELRLGQYRPDIDSEFDGAATPYADVFGDDRGWYPKLLASWTLLDRFVQVDVGAGTGWFRSTGKGLYESSGAPSPDETTFNVIPATLAVTIRVDGVSERWPVPLSVYGRAALERYHWWVTDGAGALAESGATNGWSVAGGVALLLDFIDPVLGRELDAETGVNHTWLYFEAERSFVDDFGSSSSWNLSDEELSLAGGLRLVF